MSDKSPKVSIILPTYNRAKLVKRATNSVLRQTYTNWELIVVDGPSTDDTYGVVKSFDDPRIRYIRIPKRGVGLARNIGIKLSKGELIAFIDSDAVWLPEKLEDQVKVICETDDKVAGVYTGYVVFYPRGVIKVIMPRHQGFIFKELLHYNCVGTVSTVLIKKKHLFEVGLFDPEIQYGEDWDLWLKISQRYEWKALNKILVYDFVYESGLSMDTTKVLQGWKAIARKWMKYSYIMALRYCYYSIISKFFKLSLTSLTDVAKLVGKVLVSQF